MPVKTMTRALLFLQKAGKMLLAREVADLKSCWRQKLLAQKVAGLKSCWRKKLQRWSEVLKKTPFFGGFLPTFRPVLCFFTEYLYMKRIFWKENGPSLLFLAAGTTHSKFRRSTGVTTANSTNKYQKYKSVELGDQLPHWGSTPGYQCGPKWMLELWFGVFWCM